MLKKSNCTKISPPCSIILAGFSLDCCLLLSICVIFRCMLHPLPLPLSSCLGCIPPLIGLPSLRFYAVGSSLFLLSVCFCLCSLFYRDDVLCWLLLARPFLYAFHAHLRFPVDLVWFRLSCDHGWIRSGSVNVRKQQQQQHSAHFCDVKLFIGWFCCKQKVYLFEGGNYDSSRGTVSSLKNGLPTSISCYMIIRNGNETMIGMFFSS